MYITVKIFKISSHLGRLSGRPALNTQPFQHPLSAVHLCFPALYLAAGCQHKSLFAFPGLHVHPLAATGQVCYLPNNNLLQYIQKQHVTHGYCL